MLLNGDLLSHLSQLMSLHYLGKHVPGNSFEYATGMCLLLENVGGCMHAGRPEVVTLNICYN